MSKAERTKQHILEKASTIFNTKGIGATSVEDVLKSAKVARGSLYDYFSSKDDLAYASVDYLLKTLIDNSDLLMGRSNTAIGKIHAYMSMYKNPLAPFIDGGCPIVNLAPEVDETNPVITKKVKKSVDGYLNLFTEVLKDGVTTGELSSDLDPEEFSIRMFCAIEGAHMISRIKNNIKPMQVVLASFKKELDGYKLGVFVN